MTNIHPPVIYILQSLYKGVPAGFFIKIFFLHVKYLVLYSFLMLHTALVVEWLVRSPQVHEHKYLKCLVINKASYPKLQVSRI